MYKNILRKVNFFVFIAVVVFFATIQSSLFGYFPLYYIRPDLLLILTVYLGFKRSIVEGSLFVLLASGMMEANSGAGNHFFMTVYMYTFLISSVLSKTIVVPDFFSSIGIVAGLTVLKKIGVLVLLGLNGRAENGLMHFLIYLVPGILIQAMLTPVCFHFFHWIDMKTHKDEHSEDEYDINKGF